MPPVEESNKNVIFSVAHVYFCFIYAFNRFFSYSISVDRIRYKLRWSKLVVSVWTVSNRFNILDFWLVFAHRICTQHTRKHFKYISCWIMTLILLILYAHFIAHTQRVFYYIVSLCIYEFLNWTLWNQILRHFVH